MKKQLKSNQFCHDILQMDVPYAKPLANTVMALASDTNARSPVELSLSPLFHYQYSSVSDTVSNLSYEQIGWEMAHQQVQRLCRPYLSEQITNSPVVHLQTDTTGVCHPHSPTLEKRTFIYKPNNVIKGNKPLSAGYQVSFVNIGEVQSNWSLPLSVRRVEVEQSPIACAVAQIEELFSPDGIFPLKDDQLIINNSDTTYAHPSYVAPLHRHPDLVNIVRLRTGSKVWEADPESATGGAPRIYAPQPLYLRQTTQDYITRRGEKTYVTRQPAIGEQPPDEYLELERTTTRGRSLRICLWRWNDKMWRTKQGHNMHDKPLDVLCVEVLDAESGEPVFKNPLFAGIFGMRKDEVSTPLAQESYRHRYDIEPSFRFDKQALMLEKSQTSDVRHFDNWLIAVVLALWLLFAASDEVEYVPKKWQKYPLGSAEKKRQQNQRWSPTQTRKAAQRLFLTFDPTPFLPQKSKKGKGRKKGEKQTPRPRFPVVKKQSKKAKTKLKTVKLE